MILGVGGKSRVYKGVGVTGKLWIWLREPDDWDAKDGVRRGRGVPIELLRQVQDRWLRPRLEGSRHRAGVFDRSTGLPGHARDRKFAFS